MDFLGFLDKIGQGAGGVADAMYQSQIGYDRFNNPLGYMEADDRRQVLRERQAARDAILQNPQALGQLNQIIPNAEQFLQAGGDLESLGKLRTMVLGTDRPAAIQEDLYYQTLPEERRNIFSGLQGRATVTDLGDRYVLTDRVTGEQREIMKRTQGTVTAQPRTVPTQEPIQQPAQNTDFIDMPLPPVGNDYGDGFDQLDLVPDPTMIETPQFEPAGQKGIPPEQTPEFKAAQTAAMKAAENAAEKESRTEKIGDLFAPLDLLGASAEKAPSGALGSLGASLENFAGGSSAEALAQGDFTVKKASAENAIRQAFRVAGSGAQTDKDALPFIQMLPNEMDSAPVKAAKIKAAKEAVRTTVSGLAADRGLPDPFAEIEKTGKVDYKSKYGLQ